MRLQVVLGLFTSILIVGPVSAATGGTIQDQSVSFTYPASHWDTTASADLVGAWGSPAADVLRASGWWYRTPTDTREHPFPAPDSESYVGGDLTLVWNNVDGKGFRATQVTHVIDNERPSGTLISEMTLENVTSSYTFVKLFHYLDVDIPGNGDDDRVVQLEGTRELSFFSAHGGGSIRYRGNGTFRVAPYPTLLDALNDDAATPMLDAGAPFGPGNASAAFEIWYSLNVGQVVSQHVSVSVRPSGDYVKGEASRHTGFPALWFCRSSSLPALDGLAYAWDMRRTAALLPDALVGRICDPGEQVLVGDGFRYGGGATTFVTYSPTTGITEVGGVPVANVLPSPQPWAWNIEATGDFDYDGRPDIVWRNSLTRKVVIWRIGFDSVSGSNVWLGNIVPIPDQAADANWSIKAALDFNNDGLRDLLWYNSTSGKAVIWHMDGAVKRINGIFTDPSTVGNANWKIVAAGDFGKGPTSSGAPTPVFGAPDIVWRNDTSGRLVVWHMNFAGQRTAGVFMTPDSPDDPLAVRVVGPR